MSNQIDNTDENVSFEDLFEDAEKYDRPSRGDIRPAIILQINTMEVIVDLGVKRDGVVPLRDLERLPEGYLDSLAVGDEVPVYVMNPSDRDDNLLVSLNLGLQGQDWVRAKKLLESGDVTKAEVVEYNRGGVLIKFGRLDGFVPASHLATIDQGPPFHEREEAMGNMVGRTLELKVIEVNQSRRRLIMSEREAQREWRANQKQRLLEELKVGDIVDGRVTGLRDFGVFVDLGGADGLIHVSELAWHRVPHPRDIVTPGEEVQVYVLDLDLEKQRIALSLRRLNRDPWELVGENYSIGQVVEGEVTNVVDFGAFVVLDDGIEGLLHLSEMADGSLTEPYSYIQRGDRANMRIVRVEPERRRIGFSQRDLDIETPAIAIVEEDVESVVFDEDGLDDDIDQTEIDAAEDDLVVDSGDVAIEGEEDAVELDEE